MKPPMPYYGGKQRIADHIIREFPDHAHYVEPFAGGLSVLLAKPPSKIETVNDLDGDLMRFWRVLRDRPDELHRVCALTPHSRAELSACREPLDALDDLEAARRVWCQLTQGRAGRRTRTGWRFYLDARATGAGMNTYLAGYLGRLAPAAARLMNVQLECRPALDVVQDYGQTDSTLLYVDPPYLASTRRSLQYLHEMHQDHEHGELLEALRGCAAAVVVSGYRSPLYEDLLRGWRTVEIAATTQQGGASARRVEVLWCNRDHDRLI